MTPEQRALIKASEGPLKRIADNLRKAAEDAAEANKARKNVDHARGIRDGTIEPPWAKKLREAIERSESTRSKSTREDTEKMRRVRQVLRELYSPDDMPHGDHGDKTVTIVHAVNNEFKKRGWGTVSREVIEKVVERGRYSRR